MAIGRLHYPDGEFLSPFGGDWVKAFDEVLHRDIGALVIMRTGTRMITPEPWTKHTHEHYVTVYEDGTGLYHHIPRKGTGAITTLGINMTADELARMSDAMPLDGEHPNNFPLIGPHPTHQDMRLWSCVMFVPDDVAIRLPVEQIEPPKA